MFISSRLKRAVSAALLTAVTASMFPSTAIHAQDNTRTPDQALADQTQPIVVAQPARYASIAINVSATQAFVQVGSPTTFKINLRNVGALAASNLVVSLPVPKGVTPSSKDGLNADGTAWVWQLTTLAPATSHELSVSVRVTENVPTGAVVATATVNSPQMAQPITTKSGFVIIPSTAERSPTSTTSTDGRVSLAPSKAVDPTWTMATDVSKVHPTQRGLAPVVVSTSARTRGIAETPATLVWNYTDT